MVVVFGTGLRAEELLFVEERMNIDYFIDNNFEKIGKEFYGYEVKAPQEMDIDEITNVFISSEKYAVEMKQQLLDLGIKENKISYAWEWAGPVVEVKTVENLISPWGGVRNRKDYEAIKFDVNLIDMENAITMMTLRERRKRIHFPGRCQVCNTKVSFLLDDSGAWNEKVLNFRESLVCPYCHLNNRQRIVARILLDRCTFDSNIYLTEQVTPFYRLLKKRFPNLIGSEYLGKGVSREGIRNEDLMELSFSSEEFEFVVANDVFEHVGNIDKALSEIYRVLKKEGKLYATFPIDFHMEHTIKRAVILEDEIQYLLPPMYHGNPLSREGSLVFYDFGMDIIELVKRAGFRDAFFTFYYSVSNGNLGVKSLNVFCAIK